MTISDLLKMQAGILGAQVSDLSVLGVNLGLTALNAVRTQAEQENDFEFNRQTLSLTVNTVTGGSLLNAVVYGTTQVPDIKTILDVGQADTFGNLVPVEWTTTAENLERLRAENPHRRPRYPTDAQWEAGLSSARRVTFSGDRVWWSPKPETGGDTTLIFEAYCYSPDWTETSGTVALTGSTGASGANTTYYKYGTFNGKNLWLSLADGGSPATIYAIWHTGTAWVITLANDIGAVGTDYFSLTSTSNDPAGTYTGNGGWGGSPVVTSTADASTSLWLSKGWNYLLWASVVWLNTNDSETFGKKFIPRNEGNLPPPADLAERALQAFRQVDAAKFDMFRRHGR